MALHIMTLAAGRSLLFQAMVWLPVAALVFFGWRARALLFRHQRHGDIELVERISEKVTPLLKEKEPPAFQGQEAPSEGGSRKTPQDLSASSREEPGTSPEEPGPS